MKPTGTALTPLQQTETVTDAVQETIAEVIAYLPTILSAIIILVIGFIIGRIVGGVVRRIIERIGISQYGPGRDTEGTSEGDEGDSIARALGKLVAYYIYFVTIVAAVNVLDITQLSELLGNLASYLPTILGAVVLLIVGFVVGRIIGDIVADLVGGFDIGPHLRDTPLEQFGDERGEFGHIVGLLVTYYIYLLTLLAVADIVEIEALTELLDTFAAYLPALAGALIVLLVGIWLAERVGGHVANSDASRATDWAGLGVKLFIYYVTATIALGAIGFQTAILAGVFTSFFVAFFGALAIALAIGIGVALGLGGQNYVEENIDDWVQSAREATQSSGTGAGTSGSPDSEVDDATRDSDLGSSDTDDTDFGDSDNSSLDD
uniref:mechanosensitive ion channel family protein n=1 Tax=Halobacterium sp. R2-5 TaxID=2715751 RepID=UPI00141FDDBC|nr:hypothetical protein [Halobacterium sp. R2-5]NIB98594.1 hypothetical protein [Halobacterium sp. R2-5]